APGLKISMLDLVTRFLVHVRRMIRGHGNLPVAKGKQLEVKVATPSNANSNQRYITLDAFQRAGFNVLGAMNEPSAAVLEFLYHLRSEYGPKSPKRHVIVYDLGGGTFDTSIVTIADGKHDVLGYEGVPALGGDDFDEIILDLVLEQIGVPRGSLGPAETVRLLEECRERKEGLRYNTRRMMVDAGVVLDGKAPVVLDTVRLYERCGPIIQQSLAAVQSLLANNNLAEESAGPRLAAFYIVGGSVLFPPVARALRELYKNKVKTSPYPHASTSVGLAIAADARVQMQIRETVSRHFGVWREIGEDKVFDPIFSKDNLVDAESGSLTVTRHYRPSHNVGFLRYLECNFLGKAGEPEGDISMRQNIYFPYDPVLAGRKSLAGIPIERRFDLSSQEVNETYVYDAGGIIRVEIENCTGGYRRSYRLAPEKKPAAPK
ncbi:MAG: Hsp70 family protein, partial [Desulfobacterales bacterium]